MECYLCHAPAEADHRFCMQCGLPLPTAPPKDAAKRSAILRGDFDIEALTNLREEKERVSAELHSLLEETGDRELTDHERRVCTELYGRWKRVSAEVTARVEYFCDRMDHDRRSRATRADERRKQHLALSVDDRREAGDRRAGERRTGSDRRDPFEKRVSEL